MFYLLMRHIVRMRSNLKQWAGPELKGAADNAYMVHMHMVPSADQSQEGNSVCHSQKSFSGFGGNTLKKKGKAEQLASAASACSLMGSGDLRRGANEACDGDHAFGI